MYSICGKPAPMEAEILRQTGRTTHAMFNAPKGAIYCVGRALELSHARRIQRTIERADLKLCYPENLWQTSIGRSVPIILDHACVLNEDGYNYVAAHNGRLK